MAVDERAQPPPNLHCHLPLWASTLPPPERPHRGASCAKSEWTSEYLRFARADPAWGACGAWHCCRRRLSLGEESATQRPSRPGIRNHVGVNTCCVTRKAKMSSKQGEAGLSQGAAGTSGCAPFINPLLHRPATYCQLVPDIPDTGLPATSPWYVHTLNPFPSACLPLGSIPSNHPPLGSPCCKVHILLKVRQLRIMSGVL